MEGPQTWSPTIVWYTVCPCPTFLATALLRAQIPFLVLFVFFRSFAGDFLSFFDTSYCEHVALEERLHRFGMRG